MPVLRLWVLFIDFIIMSFSLFRNERRRRGRKDDRRHYYYATNGTVVTSAAPRTFIACGRICSSRRCTVGACSRTRQNDCRRKNGFPPCRISEGGRRSRPAHRVLAYLYWQQGRFADHDRRHDYRNAWLGTTVALNRGSNYAPGSRSLSWLDTNLNARSGTIEMLSRLTLLSSDRIPLLSASIFLANSMAPSAVGA
jgi:hypothetical protein